MLTQDLSEDDLIEALVAKGYLGQAALDRIADYQLGPEPEVGGILFQIDPATMTLRVGDPLGRDGELIPLPEPAEPWNPAECPPFASPLFGLFSDDGQRVGDIAVAGQPGLLLTDDECFFAAADFRHEEHLPLTNGVVFNGAGPRGNRGLPIDLSFTPDYRFLAVMDRGAGMLTLFDSETFQAVQSHQVRAAGSNKAVNLAWLGDKAYLTDGQTSALTTLDAASGTLERTTLPVGVLGNLVPHPDGQRLFLLTLKPNFALFVIEPGNPVPSKAIPVKGDPFSLGQDPTDQMVVSPDGKTLLLMTFMNEPVPYTPVINVIDVEAQKNVHRYRIPAARKPAGLGFSRPNPFYYPRIGRLAAALALGLIDEDTVAAVKAELGGSVDLPAADPLADIESAAKIEALKQASEEALEGEGDGERRPERTDHVAIPTHAEDLIVEACVEHAGQETKGEVDLTADPVAMDRLRTAAHKVREELEWYTASRVQQSYLSGDYSLDLWIEREEVLEWLRQHERDTLLKDAKITTIPANCPNCGKNLFGSYICRLCGFELDVPESMKQKRRLSLASPPATANLKDGHVLLPDADRNRVIELNIDRQIVWQLGKDAIAGEMPVELKSPYDALRLANGNTLVVDNQDNRVLEVTPRGRPFWEVPQSEEFPDVRLYRPVRAVRLDGGNTLIVDRGHHRIIEIDRNFELKWQYGQTEMPGSGPGSLWHPSDVQRLPNGNTLITDMGNHRVIEIADGQVIWQYGNPENLPHGGEGREPGRLNQPKSAWRNESGETLIVDTGNNRVLVVNQAGEIVWEYGTTDDVDARVEAPLRAYTLAHGHLLILGRDVVVEVTPRKQVKWSGLLKAIGKSVATDEGANKPGRFKMQRTNPYLRHLEAGRQEEQAKAAATAPAAMPELPDEKRVAGPQADRMADLARMAASRLNQGEESVSNLTPLALILVYRARGLVYRVSRQKRVLWRWGTGELDRPHAAQLLSNSRVLVVDTNHHRVVEVDTATDEVVWQYGHKGASGNGPGQLANPRWAQRLPNGHTLIADQSNNRVVEVDPDGAIAWQWGSWETLNGPYACQRLAGDATLITDWSNHVVLEVGPDGDVIWQYGKTKQGGSDEGLLHYPEQATRLPNGNTLIVDTRNNRILEVHPEGDVIWSYAGEGLHKLNGPTFAQRQPDGHTVIVHGGNRQAIEVDQRGQVVWKYLLPVERD